MIRMDKIAIIGYGYVGKAMARLFEGRKDLYIYDPPYMDNNNMPNEYHLTTPDEDGQRIMFTRDKAQINSCDLGIICLPTPMKANGEVDLSLVEEAAEWVNTFLILVKSTVPPGTTKWLREKTGKKIVFSPEYIGEGKYVVQWWKDAGYPHPTDMKYHDFMIFGGEKADTSAVIEYFKPIMGPGLQYVQTDSNAAELVKYMENSWGATKVTFANEFYDIAEKFGVDYNELRELFVLDGRVEKMHTLVFPNNRGFGGKCYPKDVNGIVKHSEKNGYLPKLLRAVLDVNDEMVTKNPKVHDSD